MANPRQIHRSTPAKLTAHRGAGLMRLHRYADAEADLLGALGQLHPVQAKHRTTAHIDLADAFARDGNGLDLSRAIDSMTVTERTWLLTSPDENGGLFRGEAPYHFNWDWAVALVLFTLIYGR